MTSCWSFSLLLLILLPATTKGFTSQQLSGESADLASAHLYSGLQGRNYVLSDDALASNPGDLYSFTEGLVPSGRVKHAVAFLEPFVAVLGGYAVDGTLLDDLQLFDTRTRTWSGVVLKRKCCNNVGDVIETSGIVNSNGLLKFPQIRRGFQGDLPLPRAEHAVTSSPATGLFYVFGGQTMYKESNDLYSFDPVLVKWRVLDNSGGSLPPRRAGHSFVTESYLSGGTRLVVFGGRGLSSSGISVGLSDVWSFNVQKSTWTCDSNLGNFGAQATPIGRQYAAATTSNGYLIVYGGIEPTSGLALNDCWAFHLGLKIWQLLSKNSGLTGGFAPPPLYHSTLIPVTKATVLPDPLTGRQTSVFLLYGGLGGGGSCGSNNCTLHETVLGQVYQLTIAFTSNPAGGQVRSGSTSLDSTDTGLMSIAGSAVWDYARLTSADSDRGRLLKVFGMESVCFDQQRGLLYEVGGMQAITKRLMTANQAAVQMNGPTLMDSGEAFTPLLWDVETGEHLRQTNQEPANGPWVFQDGFSRFQPLLNSSLEFLSAARIYSVSNSDVVMQYADVLSNSQADTLAP